MKRAAKPAKASSLRVVDGPRGRILEVARRHFFEFGFARFTMDELSRELGMSKKTLYRHFPSKEEIVRALIETKAADIRRGFDEIFARPETTFFERVVLVVRHIHDQVAGINTVFFRDLQRFAPTIHDRLEAVRSEILPAMWRRLLAEGVAAGAVRKDVDIPRVSQFILVSIQALLRSESLETLRVAPHEVAEQFFDIVFAGLLTPDGHREYENNRPEF